jgi:hypothetical protein
MSPKGQERRPAEEEGRLLAIMRGLSPGELQQLLAELDGVLTRSCPEAQADGVPCPDAGSACETCGRARSVLETLRRRLAHH